MTCLESRSIMLRERVMKIATAFAEKWNHIKAIEKRRKLIIVLFVVGGIITIGSTAVLFLVGQPKTTTAKVLVPSSVSTSDNGIRAGQTGVVGKEAPTNIPVVGVYYDYMCSICRTFFTVNGMDLMTLRDSGTIVLDYHPIATLDNMTTTKYSTRAANAAATVADKEPIHFVIFNDILLSNQPVDASGLTDEQITKFATDVGIAPATIKLFSQNLYVGWVDKATNIVVKAGNTEMLPMIVVNEKPLAAGVDWSKPGELSKYLKGL